MRKIALLYSARVCEKCRQNRKGPLTSMFISQDRFLDIAQNALVFFFSYTKATNRICKEKFFEK